MGDTYQERKAARRERYKRYTEGWKQIPCGACSGSGYYDGGDPRNHPCGACKGTGKERVSPEEYAKTHGSAKQAPNLPGYCITCGDDWPCHLHI